jgi:hypothetical protein
MDVHRTGTNSQYFSPMYYGLSVDGAGDHYDDISNIDLNGAFFYVTSVVTHWTRRRRRYQY